MLHLSRLAAHLSLGMVIAAHHVSCCTLPCSDPDAVQILPPAEAMQHGLVPSPALHGVGDLGSPAIDTGVEQASIRALTCTSQA